MLKQGTTARGRRPSRRCRSRACVSRVMSGASRRPRPRRDAACCGRVMREAAGAAHRRASRAMAHALADSLWRPQEIRSRHGAPRPPNWPAGLGRSSGGTRRTAAAEPLGEGGSNPFADPVLGTIGCESDLVLEAQPCRCGASRARLVRNGLQTCTTRKFKMLWRLTFEISACCDKERQYTLFSVS